LDFIVKLRSGEGSCGCCPPQNGEDNGVSGGIFSLGDAAFLGSTGNIRLARLIVGLATAIFGAHADLLGHLRIAAEGPRAGYDRDTGSTPTTASRSREVRRGQGPLRFRWRG
jgi:hypothetical protein